MSPDMHQPQHQHGVATDLRAIAELIACARDHAASATDSTSPGTQLRSRCLEVITQLERVSSTVAWLEININHLGDHPQHGKEHAA